ncbi:MAG: hypothetical protein GXO66_04465 [Euryarchaeota archaeon]|nr:hypothetical protein [Euryarchaeota archaeon]
MSLKVAERRSGGDSVRQQLEKLRLSFKYIKGCALLSRDGEIVGCEVPDPEELAFKLSILFDLEDLEEMVIEGASGATYVRRMGDHLVYLEFTKKPNIPLLNMYLKRIIGGGVVQQRARVQTAAAAEGGREAEVYGKPYDDVLGLLVADYLLNEPRKQAMAREFRDRLREKLGHNPRVKRWGLRVLPNIDDGTVEFIVIAVVRYSKGLMGSKDAEFESSLRSELERTSRATTEEIAAKFGMPARAKCFISFV